MHAIELYQYLCHLHLFCYFKAYISFNTFIYHSVLHAILILLIILIIIQSRIFINVTYLLLNTITGNTT